MERRNLSLAYFFKKLVSRKTATCPEAGKFMLVGPVMEEGHIRGIAVIKAESMEEAQRIASGDPLVQKGEFTVEVHPIQLEDLSSIRFDYPALK